MISREEKKNIECDVHRAGVYVSQIDSTLKMIEHALYNDVVPSLVLNHRIGHRIHNIKEKLNDLNVDVDNILEDISLYQKGGQ